LGSIATSPLTPCNGHNSCFSLFCAVRSFSGRVLGSRATLLSRFRLRGDVLAVQQGCRELSGLDSYLIYPQRTTFRRADHQLRTTQFPAWPNRPTTSKCKAGAKDQRADRLSKGHASLQLHDRERDR
jgi:hypothetical protein